MEKLMTQETPAKVVALLATALTSMFLLFAVTSTNASFNQADNTLPDIFGPAKIMAALDVASNSYSKFLAVNLFEPVQNDYAVYQYNLSYIMDNASPSILSGTGLTQLAAVPTPEPQVLGASTNTNYALEFQSQGRGVWSLFFGN